MGITKTMQLEQYERERYCEEHAETLEDMDATLVSASALDALREYAATRKDDVKLKRIADWLCAR
jgi:hypothetical protein